MLIPERTWQPEPRQGQQEEKKGWMLNIEQKENFTGRVTGGTRVRDEEGGGLDLHLGLGADGDCCLIANGLHLNCTTLPLLWPLTAGPRWVPDPGAANPKTNHHPSMRQMGVCLWET